VECTVKSSSDGVVITRGRHPVGIITDRDIAIRIVAEGRDPTVTAADVMTYDPVVVAADESIETAAYKMRKHGVRRLPVVTGDGAIAGMVTADDLVMLLGRELADLGHGLACRWPAPRSPPTILPSDRTSTADRRQGDLTSASPGPGAGPGTS